MLPMARPRVHLLFSLALAWWTWRRWGPAGALAALVAGVLLDADHLVDYAVTGRGRRRTHYFAPLHGWEYPLTLALIALKGQASNVNGPPGDATSAGLALGWALHIIIDVLSNRPRHPGVYLVLYRLAYAFRREATGWEDNRRFHSWAARPWWTWI